MAKEIHTASIAGSRALWNRDALDLSSDEILAQILERGEIGAWRWLYRLAQVEPRPPPAHQEDRAHRASPASPAVASGSDESG
jgi:hypothetical protein